MLIFVTTPSPLAVTLPPILIMMNRHRSRIEGGNGVKVIRGIINSESPLQIFAQHVVQRSRYIHGHRKIFLHLLGIVDSTVGDDVCGFLLRHIYVIY